MVCDASIDGLDVGEQVHHPIEMIGARGSSGQRMSHTVRFWLYNIYIWLYVSFRVVAKMIDRRMLACDSLQAVIAQSHKPV